MAAMRQHASRHENGGGDRAQPKPLGKRAARLKI
jgi:hypothetical protein